MITLVKKLWNDESGQAMVEYALIVALISIAAVAMLIAIGPKILAAFTKVNDAMPS